MESSGESFHFVELQNGVNKSKLELELYKNLGKKMNTGKSSSQFKVTNSLTICASNKQMHVWMQIR